MDSALGLSAYGIGELDPARIATSSTRTAAPSGGARRIQANAELGVEAYRSFRQSSPLPWEGERPMRTPLCAAARPLAPPPNGPAYISQTHVPVNQPHRDRSILRHATRTAER